MVYKKGLGSAARHEKCGGLNLCDVRFAVFGPFLNWEYLFDREAIFYLDFNLSQAVIENDCSLHYLRERYHENFYHILL